MTIKEQHLLLADTGPFCRFADTGHRHLQAFVDYLGPALRITRDVEREIRNLSKKRYPALQDLEWRKWPGYESVITITDPRLLAQIDEIARRERMKKNKRAAWAEKGEFATILVAKQLQAPVLMDDGNGKRFAAGKRVVSFTTEDLCVEMAVAGALTDDEAFDVFHRVYKSSRTQFDARVATSRSPP